MRRAGIAAAGLIGLLLPARARAQAGEGPRGPLSDVSIEQKLNAALPMDVPFRSETGAVVPLGRFFAGRPVVLAFVYYRCPMLCTYVLRGVEGSLRTMSLTAGRDFDVVTVSIDPSDTPAMAAVKKQEFLRDYGRPGAASGVHFLTGEANSIRKLADAAGFRFQKDPETGEFAHAAGIMVVTPKGRLARYFYGVEYAPRDLRLALVESSKGKIGSPVDKVLLYCFHYDPSTGKYSLVVMNAVRLAGVATVALIGGMMVVFIRSDRRKKKRRSRER